MLGTREILILEKIIKSNISNSKQLSEKLDYSKRQISYSLEKINLELKEMGLKRIVRLKSGEWLYEINSLQALLQKQLPKEKNEFPNVEDYTEPETRYQMEMLLILIETGKVGVEDISDFMKVSRNTVLLDLRKCKELLEAHFCFLDYLPGKGYQIIGSQKKINYLIISIVNQLTRRRKGLREIDRYFTNIKTKTLQVISEYENHFDLRFSDNSFEKLYFLINIFGLRFQMKKEDKETDKIIHSFENDFVGQVIEQVEFPIRDQSDVSWITLALLSANTIFNKSNMTDTKIFEAIHETITIFENKSTLNLLNKTALAHRLFFHLKPAFYRIKYGVPFDDVDLESISTSNLEIRTVYEILKDCIAPIEEYLGREMPDNELRLISFYFGGEILNTTMVGNKARKRAVVVCSNGMIVANLMKQNLEELFPEIQFLTTSSIRDLNKFSQEFDLIFSNIPIGDDIPNYVVQPLMSDTEKSRLRIKVLRDFSLNNVVKQTTDIISIMKKYSQIMNEENLFNELSKYLFSTSNALETIEKPKVSTNYLPLSSYITKENIIHPMEMTASLSWQEALKKACKPLLDQKIVVEEYVDFLLEQMSDEDAHYFINEAIAIPHTLPENGVISQGASLLVSPIPIEFPGNHSVHFIIPFALTNSDQHILAINQVVKLAKDSALQHELLQAQSIDQIHQIIKEL